MNVIGWPNLIPDVVGSIWPPVYRGRRSYHPLARQFARELLRAMRRRGKHTYGLAQSLLKVRTGERGLRYTEYKMAMDWLRYVGILPKPPVKVQSRALGAFFRGLR